MEKELKRWLSQSRPKPCPGENLGTVAHTHTAALHWRMEGRQADPESSLANPSKSVTARLTDTPWLKKQGKQ